jgi:lipopolysaccharide/colanic/teichoic acid biosynthesis glycosyltransferase
MTEVRGDDNGCKFQFVGYFEFFIKSQYLLIFYSLKLTMSQFTCIIHFMKRIYPNCVKRLLDFVFSLVLLVCLSPVLAVTAIMVAGKLGRPVIFRQERPGKDARIFTIYKFRTMNDERGENGELLPDAERLTSFGKSLRRTSLDELPELLNILKGDMSFVGPRPLLVQYLPRYNETQARRHDVRPGLTGYAQVSGRNAISWEQKFEYDIQYVDHLSFGMDAGIIGKTIVSVFKSEGISKQGEATMSEFLGTKKDKES